MVKEENISEEDFKKLKEENLLFITYPGRMGDIEGCSFVMKDKDMIKFYRIENLYTYKANIYEIFPKWKDSLEKYKKKDSSSKYEIIYMGMGNLLGVDKTIVELFKSKIKEIDEKIESTLDKELKFGMTCYTYWRKTVTEMFDKIN